MVAGVQLEIFTHVAERPLTSAELAARLGVAEDRLVRLLYALAVTGFLEVRDGRFANTPEAAAFLVKGRPDYMGGFMKEMQSKIWDADLRTAESICSGRPAALHAFNAVSDEEMAVMVRGMQSSSVAFGRALARRFDFSRYRSVVDIGGGSGGLVATRGDGRCAVTAERRLYRSLRRRRLALTRARAYRRFPRPALTASPRVN